VCGVRVAVRLWPIHCVCGYVEYCHPPGLGDRAAAAFARVGITQARYIKAKRALGLKADCGCKRRQQALNRLSGHA
jgi:hypothetical protein